MDRNHFEGDHQGFYDEGQDWPFGAEEHVENSGMDYMSMPPRPRLNRLTEGLPPQPVSLPGLNDVKIPTKFLNHIKQLNQLINTRHRGHLERELKSLLDNRPANPHFSSGLSSLAKNEQDPS